MTKPEVAAEIERLTSDSPANKTGEHFKSRRKLFEEVDRLIRGRVREILPGVTLEFKQQIDKDLGLDALRLRVQRVSAGIDQSLNEIELRWQRETSKRVDAMLERIEVDSADAVIEAFSKRVTAITAKENAKENAKEVAKQLEVLLRAPKKQSKPRAKKKGSR